MVDILSEIADLTPPLFDGSKDVAMATNFRVKIGKIWLITFIRSPGIPKWIAISPFWFQQVYLWWPGYIVVSLCKSVQ